MTRVPVAAPETGEAFRYSGCFDWVLWYIDRAINHQRAFNAWYRGGWR